MRPTRFVAVSIAVQFLLAPVAPAQTTRESVASDGSQVQGDSSLPATSGNGRFVTFMSASDDLVSDDSSPTPDVFLRDRADGSIRRVSVLTGGGESNGRSTESSVTPDGRYVAFGSDASDLVAGDDNHNMDVFRHDTVTGETIRVSVTSAGAEVDFGGGSPSMSADGRWITFQSRSALVPEDGNDVSDVYVHDCDTGVTRRVSLATDGGDPDNDSQVPALSADGRFVAYFSEATNVGGGLAFYGIYVHDLATGATELVSVPDGGGKPNGDSHSPSISGDGRFVAFHSGAGNLVSDDPSGVLDVFVRDRVAGRTHLVSRNPSGVPGNGNSINAAIARGGTVVAFESRASDLVANDGNGIRDVFVADLLTGAVELVSMNADGEEGDGASINPAIADDGGVVFFRSLAANLVDDDTNGDADVFSRARTVESARWSLYGDGWPGTLGVPTIALDGNPVVGTTRLVLVGSSSTVAECGVLLVGFDDASLPTRLGGTLLVDPAFAVAIHVPVGGASFCFEIPFEAQWLGVPGYFQWLQTDDGASNGVAFSEGLELVIGR